MLNRLKRRKIHSRNIQISTYETDADDLIVEGILKDDLLVPHCDSYGEKRQPHTIHQMVVRMRIGTASFQIFDIEVEMPAFPHKGCDETSESLQRLKGTKIAPGFTGEVKKLIGGARGCSHLRTLVLSMASAAVQGFWVHRNKGQESDGKTPDLMNRYVIDTCRVWRKDGHLARRSLSEASLEPK
jgi:Protein of unknown function (DUF2889)